ncbi:MAG: DUF6544 family protein [Bacillota bacterium]
MRWLFVVLVLAHGLIHFMGFAKAFGLAELPEFTQPISQGLGVAWLVAGLALLTTAILYIARPRIWWMVGFAAVLLSQALIISSWSDASVGTFANAIVLADVLYGFASQGPASFRAQYRRAVQERLAKPAQPKVVGEADLAPLPEQLQRYLRLTGAVGQPQVHHFKASWRGRIRSGPNDPWMSFTAEQYNFPGEPSRFFRMDATRAGVPVDVYHAFQEQSATMRVRLLSLLPVVDSSGPDLTRAETVTLFNDICLLAPSTLVDPAIRWEEVDAHSVRGYYTVGANTISAVLIFNEAGELVDFVSDDRLAASADGKQFLPRRWSTPVGEYRSFGPWRVCSRGDGRWHPEEGEFSYIELELLDLQINGGR